ncbi:protein ECT2 isoform X2 [Prorops nasuta]|uniref:protein ECT2 isoform X2 n=1 Tax=Prorops nasuta TaxID=863751 RepID=UPI0034CF92AE
MEEQSVHSSTSDINSEEVVRNEPLIIPRKKRICFVGVTCDDPMLGAAAQQFSVPVLKSKTGMEYIDDTAYCTYFILQEFEGPEYDVLHKSAHRILGPTALLQLVEKRESLPSISRPLYTQAMVGSVIVFTGFRKKDELTKLINMIHSMGGSIRKEMGAKVTHLIANCCGGDKYRYAVTFRVPIMSMDWISALWENRHDIKCYAHNEDMMAKSRLKPFFGARVCFYGFPDEEKRHMCEVLQQQGGEATELDDPNCTHVVTDKRAGHSKKPEKRLKISSNAIFDRFKKSIIIPFIFYDPYTNSIPVKCVTNKHHSYESFLNCYNSIFNYKTFPCESKKEYPVLNCNIKSFDSFNNYINLEEISYCPSIEQNYLKNVNHSFTGSNNLDNQSIADYETVESSILTDSGIDMSLSIKISQDPIDSVKPLVVSKMHLTKESPKSSCQCRKRTLSTTSIEYQSEEQLEEQFSGVVDESNVNTLPDLASMRAHIVKAEWFWTSVQNEGAADEKEYLFEDYLESLLSPSASARRDSQQASTPTTASTRRKRKRLAETLSSLVQNGTDSPAVHKRRSSISDAGHLSVSGSFLDCTASPDKQLLEDIPEVKAVGPESVRKNLSPRHQVFLELVQTESNYVGILSTIMTLFKSPLEGLIETSGELLNSTEAKIIFGNFPPIYEVHKKMLEELRYSSAHWTEDISIGNIFLKFAPDLVKAYPPYVNFFENTKEMLDQCDQNKPRFHAFLKICQTKPECGRQSLKELLIKPVQRLPSISLLLNDILKHTSKNNPDHSALELSISSIKEVMTYINEDKRKTEGQLVMFDIFNEIDNCPPHLVSSHRSFIGKCEVMELSEVLSGRGDHLVLFLFTDTLEICKKRSKAFNTLKSPNTANGLASGKLGQGKPYKHIKMLSLSTIKKVVDIRETDECHKVFALMVRSNQELKEKLFSFTIIDEEVNKANYLRTLCRQMANTVCKADADTFLISLDSHQLEIDTSDVALGTLSKAFKFASRTRMKVGRAFSFNKTPSKLKRAMSTMMSPFGSTNSLTPASQQLAQMRLASCNNINELGNGGSSSPTRGDVLVAPMSVQPTRKAKCGSLSMASLRRNYSEEVLQERTEN